LLNIDYNQKETLKMELNILDKQLEQKINQKEHEISTIAAQLRTANTFKEEAKINKNELEKSILDREHFQKKLDESINICDTEKNKLIDLTKKSENERADFSLKLNECKNRLNDSNKLYDQEKNTNYHLANTNSSLKSQFKNAEDLRIQLLDAKNTIEMERSRYEELINK
jgi:hypothetical protein